MNRAAGARATMQKIIELRDAEAGVALRVPVVDGVRHDGRTSD
jgi:hypothetical protein